MKRTDRSPSRPPQPTQQGGTGSSGIGNHPAEITEFLTSAEIALSADGATEAIMHAPSVVQRSLRDVTYVHDREHEREISAWCIAQNAIGTLECLLHRFAILNARQGLPPPQLHIDQCAYGAVIADALDAAQRAGVRSIVLSGCNVLASGEGYESDDQNDTAAAAVAAAMHWAVEVTLHDCDVFSVENLILILERAGESKSLSSLTLSCLSAFDDTCMSALATAVITTGIKQLTLRELNMTAGNTLAQAICNSGVSILILANCRLEGTFDLLNVFVSLDDTTAPMPLTQLMIDGVAYHSAQTEAEMASHAENIARLTVQLNAKYSGRLSAVCRFERAQSQVPLGNDAPAQLDMVPHPQASDPTLTMQPVFRCRWNMDVVRSRDFLLKFSRQFRVFLQQSDYGAQIEVGPVPIELQHGRGPYIALASVEVSLTILRHVASGGDERSLLALRALTRGTRHEWDVSYARLQIKQALVEGRPADALARINQLTEQGVFIHERELQEWFEATEDEEVHFAVGILVSLRPAPG